MRALAYGEAHSIEKFSIAEMEIPTPILGPHDVLVCIKAFALNPIDYKVRRTRSSQKDRPVVLGWDAAGVIEKIGSEVTGFRTGDEVFYAGDLMRDGSYAQFQAVDHRIIAKKPQSLGFREAAALPLTALTAWESLFERGIVYTNRSEVLVIGGAGGVGSMATQLLKAKTPAKVIATASRPESANWCRSMGADIVVDRSKDLLEELAKAQCKNVEFVFGTTNSPKYSPIIPQILQPFGHFCLIDDHPDFSIASFKSKSLSVHWELMFTKTLFQHNLSSQGEILGHIAGLIDGGKIVPTANKVLSGLNPDHIRYGHEVLESGKSIGKIVIEIASS